MTYVFIIPTVQSAQAFFIPLFNALLSSENKVILITNVSKTDNQFNWSEMLPKSLTIFDLPIPRSPNPKKIIPIILNIKDILPKEKSIIHGHFLIGSLIVSLINNRNVIKCNTLHSLVENDFSMIKRSVIRQIERFIARNSNRLWLLNDTDYNRLNQYKSVQLLPGYGMGVDSSRFQNLENSSTIEELKKKLEIKPKDIVFIYTGRLIKAKGVPQLIQAFNSLNNNSAHLLLVGESDPAHQKIEFKANHNVHVINWQQDLKPYFIISDLYITASMREAKSVGVMEAMYCGLPVVCPPTKGISELISHKKTGFIYDKISVPSIQNAIKYFLNNPEKISQFSNEIKKDREFLTRQKAVEVQLKEYHLLE